MPADEFSNSALLEAWDAFIEKLQKEGRKSLASVISSNKPGIIGNQVKLVLSNKLMADQMDRGMPELLGFLRKKLNNYQIKISYSIEEKMEKKFVYTPEEKYAKMLELNPKLKDFRKKFELDL